MKLLAVEVLIAAAITFFIRNLIVITLYLLAKAHTRTLAIFDFVSAAGRLFAGENYRFITPAQRDRNRDI
jgi:hypothetical protein